jgi:thiamine biosynthesis lipoprotein
MIMGLPFSVHLRNHSGPGGPSEAGTFDGDAVDIPAIDAAVDAVWDSLRWADRVFSTYRQDSDISRIRRGDLAVRDADPAVAQVLDFAEIARRLTGGTFDIHHGRGVGRRGLDPSGIVKGWAAARAAAPLAALGMDYYLNAGGDVLLRSASLDRPWRIGIEHPDDPSGLLAVVELAAGAVATSGRTHRGEHIWNPATGHPAEGIAQASVIGPSLVWADILATAVVAGGIERLDLAQWPPGHDVMLVTDDGAVLLSEDFAGRFADDVPAPPFSLLS